MLNKLKPLFENSIYKLFAVMIITFCLSDFIGIGHIHWILVGLISTFFLDGWIQRMLDKNENIKILGTKIVDWNDPTEETDTSETHLIILQLTFILGGYFTLLTFLVLFIFNRKKYV